MVYFLGTDAKAPLAPKWDAMKPGFFVDVPRDGDLAHLRMRLPHRYIVNLGSHEGCGCGFRRVCPEIALEETDAAATRFDHLALVQYLMALPKSKRPDQIFGYWDGEPEPLQSSRACKISDIASDSFKFLERELITLVR